MILQRVVAVAALSALPALAWAATGGDGDHGGTSHGSHGSLSRQQVAAGAPAAADELSSGEIRRIDRDQKKITLRHGEIKHLQMPPMTMVFQVADPAWLDQFKVGDKVVFRAENINGAFTLTALKAAQ